MHVRNLIGKLLDKPNEIWKDFRKQLEQDQYLNRKYDIEISYQFFISNNPLDYLVKRYLMYPLNIYLFRNQPKETIFQIHFQFLGDLALYTSNKKTIITCHDIYNFFNTGGLKNPKIRQKYALFGLKKSSLIIAISNFTKNELIRRLNIPEEKIVVIKNAINREMFRPLYNNQITHFTELDDNSKKILYVGNETNRKNFQTLIKGFFLAKRQIPNLKFIRVGQPTEYHLKLIKTMNLIEDFVYLNNVSNIELAELYNLSDLYVTASVYEGFGLPVLEAASCGTPVICSGIPTFRELYKDFPLYFPPYDYKKLSDLIITTINNEDLKKKLSKEGIRISKKYNWEKSAEKYYNVLKSLL